MVLAERRGLRWALEGKSECLWHDCRFAGVGSAHSGTCPLSDPEPAAANPKDSPPWEMSEIVFALAVGYILHLVLRSLWGTP